MGLWKEWIECYAICNGGWTFRRLWCIICLTLNLIIIIFRSPFQMQVLWIEDNLHLVSLQHGFFMRIFLDSWRQSNKDMEFGSKKIKSFVWNCKSRIMMFLVIYIVAKKLLRRLQSINRGMTVSPCLRLEYEKILALEKVWTSVFSRRNLIVLEIHVSMDWIWR